MKGKRKNQVMRLRRGFLVHGSLAHIGNESGPRVHEIPIVRAWPGGIVPASLTGHLLNLCKLQSRVSGGTSGCLEYQRRASPVLEKSGKITACAA
jgi:hypothetical protein